MPADSSPIAIRILDKEYNVGCPAGEREALLKAAQLLDRKMREMRDSGRMVGTERVAVITALNLAHEMLRHQAEHDSLAESIGTVVQRIAGKIGHRQVKRARRRESAPAIELTRRRPAGSQRH